MGIGGGVQRIEMTERETPAPCRARTPQESWRGPSLTSLATRSRIAPRWRGIARVQPGRNGTLSSPGTQLI